MEVTNDFKNLVSDKLNEFAKANNLKGTDLERKIGIDGAWISLIRNKKYNEEKSPKIQDDKFIVIADFLGIRQNELSAVEANRLHFNTDNFIITRNLVLKLEEKKTVAILDSDISGAGKTYNTQTLCKTNPNYYYYKVSSDCTPSLLINGILRTIGISEIKGKLSEKLDMIEARLKGKGAVLIVDELETIENAKRHKVYAKIKDICDRAEGNFGFIACGIGLLAYFKAQADKDTKMMKGYKQLYSRLDPESEMLGGISKDDVEEISNKLGGLKEVVKNWILKCVPDFRFLIAKLPEIVEINEANSVEAIEKKLYGLLSKRTKVDAGMRNRFSI